MENVMNLIRNGDPSCSPTAMWFLSDEITLAEMTFQLQQMREQGIYEFFIHPADGMVVKYLSDDFFRIIRHAATEAARLGMKYWIYDEYNWPSGPSEGYLLPEKPWTRMQQICMHRRDAQPGETVSESLPSKTSANTRLLAVFAGSGDNYVQVATDTDEDTCSWTNRGDIPQTVLFFFTAWNFGLMPCCTHSAFTWNQEGYPHYIGDMDYTCDFTLGSFSRIFLDVRTNDVMSVLVNGTIIGKRSWDPYRFELTKSCVPGKNHQAVRITPTGANLYGNPTPSGMVETPVLTVC